MGVGTKGHRWCGRFAMLTNRALVDGVHIAGFYAALEKELAAFEAAHG